MYPFFGVNNTGLQLFVNMQNTDYLRMRFGIFDEIPHELWFNKNYFWPHEENTFYLGHPEGHWKAIYAASDNILTSDARVKNSIAAIPDAVLDAWGEVKWSQFMFNTGDRLHTGLVAQRIKEAFERHGLDGTVYGLLCHDEWEAQEAKLNDDGSVDVPAKDAGDVWSLRYTECLAMEAAYQRRRADRIESRLAVLEQTVGIINNN